MKIIIELQSSCFEAILCSQMFKGHNPSFKKQKKMCGIFERGCNTKKGRDNREYSRKAGFVCGKNKNGHIFKMGIAYWYRTQYI